MVTKPCPNCGNQINFEENDYEIKCNYCKREFIIKKNIPTNEQIEYTFVPRIVHKRVNVTIIFIVIGICILATIVFYSNKMLNSTIKTNIKREIDSNVLITSESFRISDISSDDFSNLHTISLNALKEGNESTLYTTIEDYSYIGTYLYKINDKYLILDVYKTKIKNEFDKETSFFGCAMHNNIGMKSGKLYFSNNCTIVGNEIAIISLEYTDKKQLQGFGVKGYFSAQDVFDYLNNNPSVEIIDYVGNVYYK